MKKPTSNPGVAEPVDAAPVNSVHLVGRVTTGPVERALPSGSKLVTFRIAVRRTPTVMTRGSAQKVDVIDCVAWSAEARRAASSRAVGDTVHVRGAVRRRFYRADAGAASRMELEVLSLRKTRPVATS